jgi:hypothetical protein
MKRYRYKDLLIFQHGIQIVLDFHKRTIHRKNTFFESEVAIQFVKNHKPNANYVLMVVQNFTHHFSYKFCVKGEAAKQP